MGLAAFNRMRRQQEAKRNENNNTEEKQLKDMTVEELIAYATEKEIDIGKSTSQDGILKKIQDAEKPNE
ncbi:MAG: hypothetical protein K0R54_2139 [Clostridiaceae bacterium]|jgi:hypothetical protein|nr:hypothetical protein [Clostridiaceae bacterium]